MKLGSIEFINSLPVDLGLISGAVACDHEIITGTPAVLNDKMLKSGLDAGPVSAAWYAEHQDKFLLLPDLSISSASGVQSVLLFSRWPLRLLKAKTISITAQGRTTPALLEIICRLRYGFRPDFRTLLSETRQIPEGSGAMLLIGDEALMAQEELKGSGHTVIDLAEEWKEWTQLPFVFAVWVVRKDFFAEYPDKVLRLHEDLLKSKKWGSEHLPEILKAARAKTGLPVPVIEKYFSCLSHDFNEGLKCGLKLYYEYAARCGILPRVKELKTIERLKPAAAA